ncbi:hypothetical protein HPB50_026591 [Hyalomma asiaticum]|uniref:Uncharacterized protein n=1 Tax=Hyalomma asiaticum TaxID=266040 RepID=A0ACB7T5W2_HYAAI|nr:hypothetical protein HPB50_026591 [Hyalomma asiaticum]
MILLAAAHRHKDMEKSVAVPQGFLTEATAPVKVTVRTDNVADHYNVEPRPFASPELPELMHVPLHTLRDGQPKMPAEETLSRVTVAASAAFRNYAHRGEGEH